MRFGKVQEQTFGTPNGAYSIVTKREHHDSQITLTGYETEILLAHFGKENIHTGNVKSNPTLSSKPFRRFPDGSTINLNIIYPKPDKTELRLYLSSGNGFKPNAGQVWFIFCLNDEIWVGAMNEQEWRIESSQLKTDESDEFYQNEINDTDPIRIATLKQRDIYTRDRAIALKRMKLADYSCEYDTSHELFISRFSRKPYVEAHHLVPMALQKEIKIPLDTVNNVFCLCPFCHRAVHHSEERFARKIISTLAAKREVLDDYSLKLPDLFRLYAVEEIK